MTRTIKSMLWAWIFAGAVALQPAVALAEAGPETGGEAGVAGLVDHATVEARGAGAVTSASDTDQTAKRVPDHVTAEARGASTGDERTADTSAAVPDHASAEARTTTSPARP